LILELICPNECTEKPIWKKIYIGSEKQRISMSVKDWIDLAEEFNKCPHPLNGKTLKTAISGTGPYLYTNWDNNVVFDEQGIPLGSNGGIMRAISEVFGFNLNISTFKANVVWDNLTGQYIVIPKLVRTMIFYSTEIK